MNANRYTRLIRKSQCLLSDVSADGTHGGVFIGAYIPVCPTILSCNRLHDRRLYTRRYVVKYINANLLHRHLADLCAAVDSHSDNASLWPC